jgi:hypothetical protein
MLLQVQLHARVNEGSITVDAARLVKELEESYARKVRTVGATALTESVRTEHAEPPGASFWFRSFRLRCCVGVTHARMVGAAVLQ